MFWFNRKRVRGSEFLKEATDIHCHLLPGVDDGMEEFAKSMDFLSLLSVAGMKRIYFTPHSMGLEGAAVDSHTHRHRSHNSGADEAATSSASTSSADSSMQSSVTVVENNAAEYEAAEKQSAYNSEPKGGYSNAHLKERFELFKKFYSGDIELRLAAEYMMNREFLEKVKANDLLTYSDGAHILVETSYIAPPVEMDEILYTLALNGYKPIIAHPERYKYMSKTDYKHLKEKGYEFQLNYLSLTGYYGPDVQERAFDLLDKGMYNFTGSDYHRVSTYYHRLPKLRLSGKRADRLMQLFKNNDTI